MAYGTQSFNETEPVDSRSDNSRSNLLKENLTPGFLHDSKKFNK
jgi:hypothetical protein